MRVEIKRFYLRILSLNVNKNYVGRLLRAKEKKGGRRRRMG